MRKIAEVLRLHHECGRSQREIADVVGASPTTVGEYLRRASRAGIGYPLPAGLDETALQARLFPPVLPRNVERAEPDWPTIHRELGRKHVTLDLLWQEYKAEHTDGYRYSAFCQHYREWVGKLAVSMRQTHAPGEKLFVDYAGTTLSVIDPDTGEIRPAQLFVAVLGASNYTFAEATWTQTLPDWLGSHVRAMEFARRRPRDRRFRQSQEWPQEAGLVRTRPQPELSGLGEPLRRCRHSGTGQKAQGQSQGRRRRAGRQSLDHRRAPEPALFQPR